MLIREARRLGHKPPRIWHGFLPLHMTQTQVEADRLVGYPSRSVVKHCNQASYALVTEKSFDRVVNSKWDDAHWICLLDLLRNGDVWVANFDCHFFRIDQRRLNRFTLRWLRLMGIKIVAVPHGADINHQGRFVSRYSWTRRYSQDYPAWDPGEQRNTAEERIALFCDSSHFVIAPDSSLSRMLPRNDLRFKHFAVDCNQLQPGPSVGNGRPIVVHAPNHRLTKGTDYLIEAVENLRHRGIDVELVLVERVPHDYVLDIYRKADVIADQFCIGAFGMYALEGLALGKPVLTYLDEEHLGDPVFNLPIVNTNHENLEQVLAILLQVPSLRERLGMAGRRSVERYQSIPALAEIWDRIYRHVWWDEDLDLSATQHFSPERKARSFTEDPACLEFWPVAVGDLMPQIRSALILAGFDATAVTTVRGGARHIRISAESSAVS